MSEESAVVRARSYYDSRAADEFYFQVWGGEDIHVGIYEDREESIFDASRRTVRRMASRLSHRGPGTRVLDVGSGYGGAARHLAREKGLRVDCLNLSLLQNRRALRMNRDGGLDGRIRLMVADFENMPVAADSYDVVWSEDSLVHSADRRRVLEEVDRVLRPGGELLFTDLLESPDCPPEILAPIHARIHLESLGSFAGYRRAAAELGWRELAVIDLSRHLGEHYRRVGEALEERRPTLAADCDPDYLDNMEAGLRLWASAGSSGHLEWGIFHFRKEAQASAKDIRASAT